MRISELIHVRNRKYLPNDRDFVFIYSHISKKEAKEIRKGERVQKS